MFPPFNQIGFGFLTFESEDAVDQVCAEHFININGKQVLSINFIDFNSLFFTAPEIFSASLGLICDSDASLLHDITVK